MKKILVLLADGFEELEVVAPLDIWRRAGFHVQLASIQDRLSVSSGRGLRVEADVKLSDCAIANYDALYVPGGREGVLNLSLNSKVSEVVRAAVAADKWLLSICAAPVVLLRAGVLGGKRVTSFPSVREELETGVGEYVVEKFVVDGKLVTSRGAGTSAEFAFEVIRQFAGEGLADEVASAMVFV